MHFRRSCKHLENVELYYDAVPGAGLQYTGIIIVAELEKITILQKFRYNIATVETQAIVCNNCHNH